MPPKNTIKLSNQDVNKGKWGILGHLANNFKNFSGVKYSFKMFNRFCELIQMAEKLLQKSLVVLKYALLTWKMSIIEE